MITFLTPGLFDTLVIAVIAVGIVLAIWRIVHDLRSSPRWPDDPSTPATMDQPEQQETTTK